MVQMFYWVLRKANSLGIHTPKLSFTTISSLPKHSYEHSKLYGPLASNILAYHILKPKSCKYVPLCTKLFIRYPLIFLIVTGDPKKFPSFTFIHTHRNTTKRCIERIKDNQEFNMNQEIFSFIK